MALFIEDKQRKKKFSLIRQRLENKESDVYKHFKKILLNLKL